MWAAARYFASRFWAGRYWFKVGSGDAGSQEVVRWSTEAVTWSQMDTQVVVAAEMTAESVG